MDILKVEELWYKKLNKKNMQLTSNWNYVLNLVGYVYLN